MNNLKESYTILGLGFDSSEQVVKNKYKELAKKYHPDLNKSSNANDMFVKITNAYDNIKANNFADPSIYEENTDNNEKYYYEQKSQSNYENNQSRAQYNSSKDKKSKVNEKEKNKGYIGLALCISALIFVIAFDLTSMNIILSIIGIVGSIIQISNNK